MIFKPDELRKDHPNCGIKKTYYTLKPDFIGRNRFIELMMELGYRFKRKKNYKRTPITSELYHPTLIKGMQVDRPLMI